MPVTVRLFAALREARGEDRVEVELLPGDTAGSVYARLFPAQPDRGWAAPLLFAVDQVWVERDRPLRDGEELALIPPLGGGAPDPRVALSREPLDPAPLLELVAGPERGGVVTFTGTTRDRFEGRPVLRLEYEAYEPMALREMGALCDAIEAEWPGVRIAMAHRLGSLEVGEAAVIVAAAGPHRDESFAACRAGIDRLKAGVPIFKKEVYVDGSTWKADNAP